MKKLKIDNNKRYFVYFMLIIISTLIVSIFSMSTSPLYPNYYLSYDSSTSADSMLIAKAMTQGYIPYKDLFAINGPLFYIIESIVWFSFNRNGIYILQIIALFFSLIFIYNISQKSINKKKTIFVIFITLFVYISTIKTGNVVEEFIMPLMLFYIYTSYFGDSDYSSVLKKATVIQIIFLLKWIYAIPFVLWMIYDIYKEKENRRSMLKGCGISFLFMMIFLIIYFVINNNLFDVIEETFIYDLCQIKYNILHIDLIRQIIKLIPVIVFLVINFCNKTDRRVQNNILGIYFLLIFFLYLNCWEKYYFMIVFILLTIIEDTNHKKLSYILFLSIFMINLVTLSGFTKNVYNQLIYQTYKEDNTFLIENIEEYSNDNELIVVDASSSIYMLTDYIPQYKYFSNQSYICQLDYFSYVQENILSYVESDKVGYMVLKGNGLVYEGYGYLQIYFYDKVGVYGGLALYFVQ